MRLIAIAVALAAGGLVGCTGQTPLDMLVLDPSPVLDKTPADYGFEYETIRVPVAEGRSTVIWHVPSKESKALVVVVPGSTINKTFDLKALPLFVPQGYDGILIDFEGFGESPGTPTLQHTLDDTLAVVAYAKQIHPTVVLYGGSMGAPLATRAAAEYDVAALVLEGSLVFNEQAYCWLNQYHLAWPPFVALGNDFIEAYVPGGFDILKYVGQVNAPKFIIHSIHDDIVPFPEGQLVYEAAADPKTFWQIDGGHGRMIDTDPETYGKTLVGWVESVLGQK